MRISLALAAALVLATVARDARADADPVIGYVFGSYALPFHITGKAERSGIVDGTWTTDSSFGRRTGQGAYTTQAAGFGAGIGYDGFNVQLDLKPINGASIGAVTFGYRLNLQFGNFETWARVAAGPMVVFDPGTFDLSRDGAGGVVAVAEAGVDWFFWKEFMAIGVKGVASPSWSFPLSFAGDFDINLGLRVIL